MARDMYKKKGTYTVTICTCRPEGYVQTYTVILGPTSGQRPGSGQRYGVNRKKSRYGVNREKSYIGS